MENQDGLFAVPEKKDENAPPSTYTTEIQDAIVDVFEELEKNDLLTAADKAKRAVLVKSARALDRGLAGEKITVATSNLLTRVMDALDTLPRAGGESDSMDAWDAAALDATKAAMEAEADAADDLTPVPPVDEWATQCLN